ncbi:flavin reductase family protein [Streptomyces hirsutus]|uniref:flavin reductase family protein n=1 Tax=Streptomyces hirsutus TaxID=35620 RepID=UPI000A51A190|nr:flavin reductase family protein [Streptomyces hirsutus]
MIQNRLRGFDADPLIVRQTFAQFPSGVAALAADIDGAKHALVASSFMVGVSLEPCLVAVAVQKTSVTWEQISKAGRLGVSIFGKGQSGLTRQLAHKDRAARFEQVAIEVSDDGAVFIDGAALWLDCSISGVSEAGDHWMVLLEAHRLGAGENEPLVWHGSTFRELASPPAVDAA